MSGKPDDIPDDVWSAAGDPAYAAFDASVDLYETGVASADVRLIIARAILAERKRCASVANERAAHLFAGMQSVPSEYFAAQMVEALLIEQRITQAWVPTDSIRVEGFHP